MQLGIDLISFYTSQYYLDLKTLAAKRGVDFNKFYTGIGQERMALPPPDEDIVTMAASAALPIVAQVDKSRIELVLFATESGIDQSKAAALFAHELLGLSPHCRAIELKEACYAATAGLRMAMAMVAQRPQSLALVLAADIARYDLGSPGEPTQGCGAVAILVGINPRVLAVDPESGFHAENVMDFWRPNYREEALVDGKYSTRIYLQTLLDAWKFYQEQSGRDLAGFSRFCFHLPFTKIAEKSYERLAKTANLPAATPEELARLLGPAVAYNRLTGNSYTACVYQSLCSLMDNVQEDLAGQRVGLFSYGSGCMAEFYSGVFQPGYRAHLFTPRHQALLNGRTELSYQQYEDIFNYGIPRDGGDHMVAPYRTGPFRLAGIKDHKRQYESA